MEVSYRKLAIPAVIIIIAIIVLLVLSPGKSSATGLALTPSTIKADTGEPINVAIQAQNIDNLGGAQISIMYDPSALTFSGTSEGTFLSESGKVQTMFVQPTQPQPGVLQNILLVRLDGASVSGSGDLARITFTPLRSGKTSVTISSFTLSDSLGNKIETTSSGTTINVE